MYSSAEFHPSPKQNRGHISGFHSSTGQLPPMRLPLPPPPSPLRRDQSLAYAIHRVYCHLLRLAEEGDTRPSLTTGEVALDHPALPRSTRRGGFSLAAATLLGLSLGALSTFAHAILGAFLTLRRAAGAAAWRSKRECPVWWPLPASVSIKREGGKEGCWEPRRCPLPSLTRSLTQHVWHVRCMLGYRGGRSTQQVAHSPLCGCRGVPGMGWGVVLDLKEKTSQSKQRP